MFGQAKIKLVELAPLCRRLAAQLKSGVDARKVWRREAENARGSSRGPMQTVSAEVDRGSTQTEALAATGDFFPVLFRELADVGEQSGHQAEVFQQMAGHYEHQMELRRNFRAAITWPVIQLVMALAVVGLLIWLMGLMLQRNGRPLIDFLGLGLYGTQGLMVYLTFLGCVAVGLVFVYRAVRRGVLWTRPLQEILFRIPRLGTALETLAMSRLCWSLNVTFESGMDLRRAIALSLRSTHAWRYVSQVEPVWQSIRSGQEFYEALGATSVFPRSFIDAIEVGEHSGRMGETLSVLSDQYQQEARSALSVLTQLAGFAVWALVAFMIVMILVQVVSSYAGLINDLARPGGGGRI